MSDNFKECQAIALQLPPKERAALARQLIASLDALGDAEIENPWVDEAEKRYQEYKKGNAQARDAEEVLRAARAAIK